ncbi:aldo/keto reductase [Luteimonas sp. BDR2-5]|uniref:aldo/keto reductase n=1 Tax=Proluteimonas luteida TaxID=2878685 RepID=UPI001E45EEA0|nr:aldo/keto reductase [Luteimonas sp. BDR2-5]MCD9027481.1 aldo/keto reductase [Luteimonas sp. BDR2-5]
MFSRRKFLTTSLSAASTALVLAACGNDAAPAAAAPASAAGPDPATGGGADTRPGKRRLGRSTVEISPLVLGTNTFGWTADRERSFEILDRFSDAGLETLDTANMYSTWAPGNSGGESETIIGDWFESRGKRDAIVLITKVGMELDGQKGLSAAYIERAAEDSLRRLKTDYIDVYFSHEPDPGTPHEETLRAYQRLIEAGKVRTIGASNYDAGQVRAALEVSAAEGLPRYEVLQPRYNLYDRGDFDGPLHDLAIAEDLGVITYSSLASGFLTGKYRSEADLGQSPRGGGVGRYLDERGLRILAALDDVAARHEAELAEVSLAWIIAREGVTAPIASATSIEQLDSLVAALDLQLTAEDLQQLDQASAI